MENANIRLTTSVVLSAMKKKCAGHYPSDGQRDLTQTGNQGRLTKTSKVKARN